MKLLPLTTFVLVEFIRDLHRVHIHGTIIAKSAEAAAASIGSRILSSDKDDALNLRHRLAESRPAFNEWFLEEVPSVTARPEPMNRK